MANSTTYTKTSYSYEMKDLRALSALLELGLRSFATAQELKSTVDFIYSTTLSFHRNRGNIGHLPD